MSLNIPFLFLTLLYITNTTGDFSENSEQCSMKREEGCDASSSGSDKYTEAASAIYSQIQSAVEQYEACAPDGDPECSCHQDVIKHDLLHYEKGITQRMIEDSVKYGTLYKIHKHRLYRDPNCMFPARCTGLEHFLLKLLPELPDMDFVVNTRDWPQLRAVFGSKGPVFSFSKTSDYLDITYPAWTFWAGGPAISLHPTGIGRWDLLRESVSKAGAETPWPKKKSVAFFRGSRTSEERDSIVLLSRRDPEMADAKYTKNQAWKSPKDTLNAEPATEVTFEDHCHYKYLFNFRGVAASFRLKHLFLCKSLVFHVGDEWTEFFYAALKPWVHYVPVPSYPSQEQLEQLLNFFHAHDDLAQQIAARGYDFIQQHLRMEDVECYWRKLLLGYKSLLKYTVKAADKNLIEIKEK